MAPNGRTVGHHFLDHCGRQRLAPAIDVILVEVDRERVAELFENRESLGVGGFPAVIHRDHDRLRGDRLAAVLPRDEIGHRDHRNAEIAYRLHLLAELRGADPHRGLPLILGEIVISQHRHAHPVVRDIQGNSRLGDGCGIRPLRLCGQGHGQRRPSDDHSLNQIHFCRRLAANPARAIQTPTPLPFPGRSQQNCRGNHPRTCQAYP